MERAEERLKLVEGGKNLYVEQRGRKSDMEKLGWMQDWV